MKNQFLYVFTIRFDDNICWRHDCGSISRLNHHGTDPRWQNPSITDSFNSKLVLAQKLMPPPALFNRTDGHRQLCQRLFAVDKSVVIRGISASILLRK